MPRAPHQLPGKIPDYLEPVINEVVSRVVAGVAEVIVQHLPDTNAPVLLDRNGIARALGVSLSSLDRLKHAGMPTVRVLDSPRFDLADIVQWLKSRPPEWWGDPSWTAKSGILKR